MKKILLSIAIIGSALQAKSQCETDSVNWTGTYGATQNIENTEIVMDNSGNTFVVSNINGNIDFDFSASATSFRNLTAKVGAVSKYDADGGFLWSLNIGGANTRLYGADLFPNGDIALVGMARNTFNLFDQSANLVQTVSGGQNWSPIIIRVNGTTGDGISAFSLPDNNDTRAIDIEVDNNSNMYLTAYSDGGVFLPGANIGYNEAAYLLKLDEAYNTLWARAFIVMDRSRNQARCFINASAQNDSLLFVAVRQESREGNEPLEIRDAFAPGDLVESLQRGTARNWLTHIVAINKSDGSYVSSAAITQGQGFDQNFDMVINDLKYDTLNNAVVIAGTYNAQQINFDAGVFNDSPPNSIKNSTFGITSTTAKGFVARYNINTSGNLMDFDWARTFYNGPSAGSALAAHAYGVAIGNDGNIHLVGSSQAGLRSAKFGSTILESLFEGNASLNIASAAYQVRLKADGSVERAQGFDATSLLFSVDTDGETITYGGELRGFTKYDPNNNSAMLGAPTSSHDGVMVLNYKLTEANDCPIVTRLYVDENSAAGGNGLSWNTAFQEVSAALAAASKGDTILIAAGDYAEPSLVIDENITVIGGFDGTSNDVASAQPFVNTTRVGLSPNDFNIQNVHNNLQVTADTVALIGIEISGGRQTTNRSNATPVQDVRGAGLLYQPTNSVNSKSLLIDKCVFKDNSGHTEGAGLFLGLDQNVNYDIAIRNSIIAENSSRYATGLFIRADGADSVNAVIVNCLFDGNYTKNITSAWTGLNAGAACMVTCRDQSYLNALYLNNTFTKNNHQGTRRDRASNSIVALNVTSDSEADLVFQNNLVFGNLESDNNPNEFVGLWDAVNSASTVTMNNNYVPALAANTIATSVINNNNQVYSDDPFVDYGNGDYLLSSDNGAISAGDTAGYTQYLGTTDLAGNDRVFGEGIDIGAYESSIITSLNELTTANVAIYPNPTTGVLFVPNGTVSVFDLSGKLIQFTNVTTGQINLQGIQKGAYFIAFNNEVAKILVQ